MTGPQLRASHPDLSAFVAANAGSGKTKTLVDRVARLLLRGADPARILCVTYTKAAAAEMQRRLFAKLGRWSVLEDAGLASELAELGEPADDLAGARRLFARALETPGGLKIQTLHAFSEKLLRRFPLEAGAAPGFQVAEDAVQAEISREARDRLGRLALSGADPRLSEAYAALAGTHDPDAFAALLGTFETERLAIAAAVEAEGGLEGALAAAAARCGFPDGAPPRPEDLEQAALGTADLEALRSCADALLACEGVEDPQLGAALSQAIGPPAPTFEALIAPFLTDKGPRKILGRKGCPEGVRLRLAAEGGRLMEAWRQWCAARCAWETGHALVVADAYGRLYEEEKRTRGLLDFPDLIAKTRSLLTSREATQWVLFKLDGGLDHVLLDEAQDTSPDQWDVLEALAQEFFVGESARGQGRTAFLVGDEKQSIFSFQGADPEQLRSRGEGFERRAREALRPFETIPLLQSWRSAPEVLRFVDAVFSDSDTRQAVRPPPGAEAVVHEAVRAPGEGCVDLWDLAVEIKAPERDAWDDPLDAPGAGGARKALAARIAEEVARILREDAVRDGDPRRPDLRPARPGDVLILVRKRGAMFEEVLRALKDRRVPVAGADRLRLSDHILFQDVLSLFRTVLFPDDDLSLAEVLRSPFCDVSEADLFDLAARRTGRLWAELRARADERPAWSDALDLVQDLRARRSLAPFELLARLMSRRDRDGLTMRRRLATRLGPTSEDVIQEILSQTLAAEARGVRDLERLTRDLERADIVVKRELDAESGGYVRVMTVHGSKGLEAPVVILPEAAADPEVLRGRFLPHPRGGWIKIAHAREDCPAAGEARLEAKRRAEEEDLRLLYVALTRARDRLIIAGRRRHDRKGPPAASWWARAARALDALGDETRILEAGEAGVRRFGADPPRREGGDCGIEAATPPVPPWAERPIEAARTRRERASPRLDGGRAPSPLAARGGLGRFRRGVVIHRLLEVLPDVAADARRATAERLLARERDLPGEAGAEMIEAALSVLEDPRFGAVFGPGSRGEAALVGRAPDGAAVSARVDRLLVRPDQVLVVDFKTNRPAPDRPEDVDVAYVDQMALYVHLLEGLYRDRPVAAALVWTDGPRLTELPRPMIEAAVRRLAERR